jgi:hypothetical protein
VTPVDDITVEVKEEVGTSTVFLAPEAIGAFTMRMPMVMVNLLIGFYFKNRWQLQLAV